MPPVGAPPLPSQAPRGRTVCMLSGERKGLALLLLSGPGMGSAAAGNGMVLLVSLAAGVPSNGGGARCVPRPAPAQGAPVP